MICFSTRKIGLSGMLALMLATVSSAAMAGEFEDALKSAYETNPRIKAQRKVLEQADEGVSEALSNFRPTIAGTYANGRQRTRFEDSDWSHSDVENKSLTINQPIFLGGANFSRYESAKDSRKASRADLWQFEQEVMLEAITAYMNVVQAQSVLELSENNEDVLDRQLNATMDRFDVGDVTRTDVSQSESRLSRAHSDTIQARGDLESALAQFERVVGYRPEKPLSFPDTTVEMPDSLEESIERALANSPFAEAAEYRSEAAESDIDTNIAAILPKVRLVGTMRREDGAGVLGTSSFDTDQVTVNVDVPLYQSGGEYSRVRSAKLRAKQLDFNARDAEEAVREATIQAWEDWQTSNAIIVAQDEEIRASEVALEGVRQEQQYGARTILDVLDAEQELFAAKVNLVRAQRNRMVAIYNVLLVQGELNPTTLALDTKRYDTEDHYDDVKWQLIGF